MRARRCLGVVAGGLVLAGVMPMLLAAAQREESSSVADWLVELAQDAQQRHDDNQARKYLQQALLVDGDHPQALRLQQQLASHAMSAAASPAVSRLAAHAPAARPASAPLAKVAVITPAAVSLPPTVSSLSAHTLSDAEALQRARAGFDQEPSLMRLAPSVRQEPLAPVKSPTMSKPPAEQPIRVFANGRQVELHPEVQVEHGVVLVPFQALAEALGYQVLEADDATVEFLGPDGQTSYATMARTNRRWLMPLEECAQYLPLVTQYDDANRALHVTLAESTQEPFHIQHPLRNRVRSSSMPSPKVETP